MPTGSNRPRNSTRHKASGYARPSPSTSRYRRDATTGINLRRRNAVSGECAGKGRPTS